MDKCRFAYCHSGQFSHYRYRLLWHEPNANLCSGRHIYEVSICVSFLLKFMPDNAESQRRGLSKEVRLATGYGDCW
jgi:hypothetical protein